MITLRGVAIALHSALDHAELQQLADRLSESAADLEIRSDEELESGKRRIIARRANVLGEIAEAIEAEMEVTA